MMSQRVSVSFDQIANESLIGIKTQENVWREEGEWKSFGVAVVINPLFQMLSLTVD